MKRSLALSVLLAVAFTGCTTYQEERDTTQPMKLRKSAFEDGGTWYMMSTVIDSPYEAGFTFPGETGGYYGVNKVKWVIEQNFLYAYRTHEFIRDQAMADGRDDYMGVPVAAYRIQAHFDVWHQYNPVTGERMPVIYEAHERPWWEREWIRVDWSTNHVRAFNWMFSDLCKADGSIVANPIAYFPTHPDDPEQFYVAKQNIGEAACASEHGGTWVEDERSGGYCNIYGWDNIEQLETFDYVDVVNREFVHVNIAPLLRPGGINLNCLAYPTMALDGGMQVTYRHSFMRVPEQNDYEPKYMPERSFERYGYFRLEREVFDPERGVTDIKDEFANRWNIWQRTTDDNGNRIPKAQRQIRPIVYYYIPVERMPSMAACERGDERFCIRYVTDALYHEVAGAWNEAFRDTLRAVGHPEAETADVVVARPIEYTCGPDGNRMCQGMGDLRYSFLWNHDEVHAGSPGGYGPPFVDPESGEIIGAAAHLYGGWWRRYAGILGDYYDLHKGDITELEIMTGENIREYYANLGGNVLPPQMPLINFEALERHEQRVAAGELKTTDETRLNLPELQLKQGLQELKRSVGSDFDRRAALVGTAVERKLITPDLLAFMGMSPDTRITEEVLDLVSPFRDSSRWRKDNEEWETFYGKRAACHRDIERIFDNPNFPTLFDWAEEQVTAAGQTPSRRNVIDFILQRFWYHVELHEVGHNMGLRHNFEGSFDEENFLPEYWQLQAELPSIRIGEQGENGILSDYDFDDDGVLSPEEYDAFYQDYVERRTEQLAAGMDQYRYSTVMDYLDGFHVGIHGLGRFDHAAVKFAYGNVIEMYSNDQNRFDAGAIASAGGWDDFVQQRNNRIDVPYYLGGERCNANAECPHANHNRVPQRCRADRGLGSQLTNGTPEDLGVCSSIWDELERQQRVSDDPVFPNYRFCSDERVRDRPFCNRGDSGTSAQEIVQNAIDQYEWNYIFNNFRRYRGDTFQPFFYYNRLWGRTFMPIGKLYQSLLYNYYYRDGFAENLGAGGMLDTFLASRNGLNFFAKILATPDIGSYIAWDPNEANYDGPYTELHAGWADFYVPMGIGKYLWSAMDEGYYGQLYRYARIGTFFDKLFAIEALTTRDWGLPQANDETFPINYYDAFQDEMIDLFTSLISGDMTRYAPVIRAVDEDDVVTSIEYRDFWKGGFFGTATEDFRGLEAVSGEDQSWRYEGEAVLNAGGSVWVRIYALLYALLDFPVFFDANFPAYVQLYSYGRPSVKDLEAIEAGEADGTLIAYTSPDRDITYVVPQVSGDRSVFFPLIEKAKAQAERLIEIRETMEQPYEDWAGFWQREENGVCAKILGLRDSAPMEDNDHECITWLASREESQLSSTESFLRLATEFLTILGYSTQ
jgi:hypothetical protein